MVVYIGLDDTLVGNIKVDEIMSRNLHDTEQQDGGDSYTVATHKLRVPRVIACLTARHRANRYLPQLY